MINFQYAKARDQNAAMQLLAPDGSSKYLAGGTNLIDLMRENIETPAALVDISGLPLDAIEELEDHSVRVGATAKNSHMAAHPLIRQRYPLLSQAILMGASGQLRNMATTAGNLMQRTRCYYFYDTMSRCNKRVPGSGCDALGGFNRVHAILGASSECIATHPSDMCVALSALDATVRVLGTDGERSIPFTQFHRLPGDTPHLDTELPAGDLILSVDLPPLAPAMRSTYRKVRDRASYAFALVSVAAAIDVQDGMVRDVRAAFGGVAHRPWRAHVAERFLIGKEARSGIFAEAIALELEPAVAFPYNAFKIELLKRVFEQTFSDLVAKGEAA